MLSCDNIPSVFPPISEAQDNNGLPVPAPIKVDIFAIVDKTFFTDEWSGLSAFGFESLYNANFIVSLFVAAPCHNSDKSAKISSYLFVDFVKFLLIFFLYSNLHK